MRDRNLAVLAGHHHQPSASRPRWALVAAPGHGIPPAQCDHGHVRVARSTQKKITFAVTLPMLVNDNLSLTLLRVASFSAPAHCADRPLRGWQGGIPMTCHPDCILLTYGTVLWATLRNKAFSFTGTCPHQNRSHVGPAGPTVKAPYSHVAGQSESQAQWSKHHACVHACPKSRK